MTLILDTPYETAAYHLSNMPLVGAITYLSLVYLFSKSMATRKAISIPKPVLVFYNVAQVLINLYVAYAIAAPLGGRVWGIGLKDNAKVRYGVFLHMLCKYLDYCDTLIIVLRKKSEQLSFLHLWHHFSILIVWGWVVNTWPSGAEGGSAAYAYGAWINSCIHVVMYAYYGLTAMNIRPPPPLKKAVTSMQLTQFASCIVHAFAALALDTTPIFYNAVQVVYHIGMLKLFLPLLLSKQGGKSAPKEVDKTPAQKESVKAE